VPRRGDTPTATTHLLNVLYQASWTQSGLDPVSSTATLRFDASVGNRGPNDVRTVPADCGKSPLSLPQLSDSEKFLSAVGNSRHCRDCLTVKNYCRHQGGCLAMGNSCRHRHSWPSGHLGLNLLAAYLPRSAENIHNDCWKFSLSLLWLSDRGWPTSLFSPVSSLYQWSNLCKKYLCQIILVNILCCIEYLIELDIYI